MFTLLQTAAPAGQGGGLSMWIMLALIFVVMWRFVGYHMVIQIAAMKNIPGDLYEAAEIDGAS